LHSLLCEQHPETEVWRKHVNDCLELAIRYKLKDADLDSRLRKGDRDTFEAAINELKCARCLENSFGKGSLRWHPEGSKGRIGEFEIVSGNLGKPVFVEVKTIVPRAEECLEWRVKEKLSRYAERVTFPFMLDVHMKELGKADVFSGKGFKMFLEGELSKIGPMNQPIRLPDYVDDKTGLYLEIQASPTSRGCYIGIFSTEGRLEQKEDYIHHSLKKAFEKPSKASKGSKPFLVILCSATQFPIHEDHMLDVLLGNLGVRFSRSSDGTLGGPIFFRKLDGFTRPKMNRHLSAIGIYRERFTYEEIQSELEVYHNPWAWNPIDPTILQGKGVRQFVKIDDKHMGWMN